jgi:hypothetical protein
VAGEGRSSGWRGDPARRYDITRSQVTRLTKLSCAACLEGTRLAGRRLPSAQIASTGQECLLYVLYSIPSPNALSRPEHPHVTIMPEVVPQVALTKALTNNDALAAIPQDTPPRVSGPGTTVDNINNDGAFSSTFPPTLTCEARIFTLLARLSTGTCHFSRG